MEKRWPWLVLASALWTTTMGLTFLTCQDGDLGTAMCAAVSGQAACTISALVIAECIVRHLLAHHREAMAAIVAAERVSIETIAEQAARAALAQVRELRP